MGNLKNLFKSKKRLEAERLAKEEALKLEEEQKRSKEFNTKVTINKYLNNMRSQNNKLDQIKNGYIEQARKASLINNEKTLALAKQGLKSCISKQRYLETMISTFEISLQTNEMNKIVCDFIEGMNLISENITSISSTFDIAKAQSKYKEALNNNMSQNIALDEFINEASNSLEFYDGTSNDVSDEEIDEIINAKVSSSESSFDDDIDIKLNEIRAKLNA